MEAIIKSLHDSIKKLSGKPFTQIMVVNLDATSPHIWVNEDCSVEPGLSKFKKEPYTGGNFHQLLKEIDTAAISSEAKTMCNGISYIYTAEQIQSVGFGVFVFEGCSSRRYDTTSRYKNLQGFVACEMTNDELKIELICAGLRGLGTPLMNFIIQSAKFYNKKRITLEAATIELACKYYPKFGFEFTDSYETMETVCKTRPRLRGDILDVIPLVRAPHDKMWNMHLKLETYNDKLRPRTLAAAEEGAAEAEAEAEAEAAAEAAEEAGGGPAPAPSPAVPEAAAAEAAELAAAQGGNGRSRKRKRSLKRNKKSRKNKTKTLKRKVGRNTSKKRKNNVH